MEYMKGSEPYSYTSSSDIGILVIHGFTGTTSSLKYLGDAFGNAGYNVESPRLSGHGTKWQDLNKIKYTDWIRDVENSLEILKKRCKKIFLAGLSMGGNLSLYLAENYTETIDGIILINHLYVLKDPLLPLVPILRFIIPSVPGISSDIKDPNEKEISYDRTPVNGVYEMTKLMKIVRKNIKKVTQPTLIFKSKFDHVIPIESAFLTFNEISSNHKEIVWLENSYHVATMDYDKDIIVERSLEFIKKYGD